MLWNHPYNEHSAITSLMFKGETNTSVRSFLGATAQTKLMVRSDLELTPTLRAAWVHDYTADRSITAAFKAAPDFVFHDPAVVGVKDAARLDLGMTLSKAGAYEVQTQAGATLAPGAVGMDASIGMKWRW